ncbi:hypothetical protein DFA_08898 [Cavenderia fasciculata]|uniref:Transmembrane protein n=1 Tax=Cavenderia fasciculata TaxID=261658 RepID=F4Q4V1_CACFS|nr:uncharacterized protein DFA_08898 [Cavenderia fasciculata]EGG17897.1 hypothetical protein DFA_08898 [Cavenderia fasciculata]|eukprot:XP_004356381.1 hypothetical protein DFA_08898 [Cavenderia fasciculata]
MSSLSFSTLIICLLFIVSIVSSSSVYSSVQFKAQDCSEGCDFFQDSNWIGGSAPQYNQNATIDFSTSYYHGNQYIYTSNGSPFSLLNLNITSGRNNNVTLVLSVALKLDSLNLTASWIQVDENVIFNINENASIANGGGVFVGIGGYFVVVGNTTLGYASAISLHGNATFVAFGSALIEGYLTGYPTGSNYYGGQFEFLGSTIISRTDVVAELIYFNDTLIVTGRTYLTANRMVGRTGNFSIVGSDITVGEINVNTNVSLTLGGTLKMGSYVSNSYIAYLEGTANTQVYAQTGNFTTFANVSLLGETLIFNASVAFGNGNITSLEIDNDNNYWSRFVFTNVSIAKLFTAPTISAPITIEVNGNSSLLIVDVEMVNIVVFPSATLNLTTSQITMDSKSSLFFNGANALFNYTYVNGGSVSASQSSQVVLTGGSKFSSASLSLANNSQLIVSGSNNHLASLVLGTGAQMNMTDGTLYIASTLTVNANSAVNLNLTSLATSTSYVPIICNSQVTFSYSSRLTLTTKAKGVALGTQYYLVNGRSEMSIPNFTLYPTQPGRLNIANAGTCDTIRLRGTNGFAVINLSMNFQFNCTTVL